jgi:hypothetical protein
MLYEIINMSDPYTIEAKSLDVAFVACLCLGDGQYAFEPIDDEGNNVDAEKIPLFFGSLEQSGIQKWSQEHFGELFQDVVARVRTEKRLELADCLDSCLIGDAKDRDTYYAGLKLIDDPAKRQQWLDRWHDKRRSSLNDIGGRAYAIAENFRKNAPKPIIPAPRQVFKTI